jgi:AbrB family looped-hinge helix DNA binding protein
MMKSASSRVTTKFQTTIPKLIRERLKLTVKDTLNWQIDDDKIIVRTNKKPFLSYRNHIKIGPGEIEYDREVARQKIADKYR